MTCSRSPTCWRLNRGHGASLLSGKPPNPSELQWLRCELGTLCSLAAHGVEEPCEAGPATPQPLVGTGLLPGLFPPGPSCWFVHTPLKAHTWCRPPGLRCQGPSGLRPQACLTLPLSVSSGLAGDPDPCSSPPQIGQKFPNCKFSCHPLSSPSN